MNDILRTLQAASDDNATFAMQWVLVPLDMPQELSSLGGSILIMQFPGLSHRTTELCNYFHNIRAYISIVTSSLL
jgi:hypothetical protein